MSTFTPLNWVPIPWPHEENPYLAKLGEALVGTGCTPPGARKPLTLLESGAAVLHLHWIWLNKDPLRNLLRKREIEGLLRTSAEHGVPVIWTMHNAAPHETSDLASKLWNFVVPRLDGIITHTAASADVAEPMNKRARVRVIPHGPLAAAYGPALQREEARKLLGLPERATFLCFGQVRPYRCVPDLLAAFRRFKADATLVIAGSCTDATLRRQIEEHAEGDPRVSAILERVPDELVPTLFSAADWIALPYRAATTSGVANLAMGLKRPVILPDIASLREGIPARVLATFRNSEPLESALSEALTRNQPVDADFPLQPSWADVALEHRRFFDELRRAFR